MNHLKLYTYFRSSASYRVRAALNLKKLEYECAAINLKTGEHLLPDFSDMSHFSELPILEHNGQQIAQSMAIIKYLDEEFPETYQLFPKHTYDRAITLQMCEVVNSGIHPIQNLKIGKKLKKDHGFSNEDVFAWSRHWIDFGFQNLEKLLKKFHGKFCFGNEITAADLFLVPQIYNARRFDVDMDKFTILTKIEHNCLQRDEIRLASPGYQQDTPNELKEKV